LRGFRLQVGIAVKYCCRRRTAIAKLFKRRRSAERLAVIAA
jgi:hypothetical protein